MVAVDMAEEACARIGQAQSWTEVVNFSILVKLRRSFGGSPTSDILEPLHHSFEGRHFAVGAGSIMPICGIVGKYRVYWQTSDGDGIARSAFSFGLG